MLLRIHKGLALGFLLLLGSASSQAATSVCDGIAGNLVQNCGFEASPIVDAGQIPTDWQGSQFLSNFDLIEGSRVDSGSEALQIANDQNQAGEPLFSGAAILSQTFTDTPGEQYAFSFYLLNGDPGGSSELFQTFWGTQASPTSGTPLLADDGSGDVANTWALESFTVTGTGSDTITFTSYNNPSFFYLDDASLVDAGVSTAPEPGTMALAGAALAALGIARRRRRA